MLLRSNRRLQAAMRSSRLSAVETLDQFDFSFQPSIKQEPIESLHELGFLARVENVTLLGPRGWARPTWRSVWRSPTPSRGARSTRAPWRP